MHTDLNKKIYFIYYISISLHFTYIKCILKIYRWARWFHPNCKSRCWFLLDTSAWSGRMQRYAAHAAVCYLTIWRWSYLADEATAFLRGWRECKRYCKYRSTFCLFLFMLNQFFTFAKEKVYFWFFFELYVNFINYFSSLNWNYDIRHRKTVTDSFVLDV